MRAVAALLQEQGFSVAVDDDKLIVFPPSRLTDDIRRLIRENKAAILAELKLKNIRLTAIQEFLHAKHVWALAQCEAQPDEERTATDEAEEWLLKVLRPGPWSAGEIQKQARQLGISEKALRRGRERLGIKPRKRDFVGGWYWELPTKTPQTAQDDPLFLRNLGDMALAWHLRGEAEVF
jgi:hypothetical protein